MICNIYTSTLCAVWLAQTPHQPPGEIGRSTNPSDSGERSARCSNLVLFCRKSAATLTTSPPFCRNFVANPVQLCDDSAAVFCNCAVTPRMILH